MVDLHCHILPGIDDGAPDADACRDLLERERDGGVDRLVFTPHFYSERETPESFLRRRAEALAVCAPICGELGLAFRVGAEVAFTPFLTELQPERFAFSGTPYLLLELPFLFEPPDVEGVIRRLRDRGLTPVLAHVERYPYIEQDPTLLYRWVRAGALAQINAGWLLRERRAVKRAEQLADWGLVHVAASDAHSPERRPPNLAAGLERLPQALSQQLRENADAIFSGAALSVPVPRKPAQHFGRWR